MTDLENSQVNYDLHKAARTFVRAASVSAMSAAIAPSAGLDPLSEPSPRRTGAAGLGGRRGQARRSVRRRGPGCPPTPGRRTAAAAGPAPCPGPAWPDGGRQGPAAGAHGRTPAGAGPAAAGARSAGGVEDSRSLPRTNSLIFPLIISSFICTIISDIVCCLLSEWCIATSFYQSLQAMFSFVFSFLSNLLYLIVILPV